jgi:hypothetical protein
MLQIQSKRFYLDVKQNRRGRFIKVAEVSIEYFVVEQFYEFFENQYNSFSNNFLFVAILRKLGENCLEKFIL